MDAAALVGLVVPDPKRKEIINKLPVLTEEDLSRLDQRESCCPICFTPFLAVLASEEMALAMDSPAVATEDLGVTRLAGTCDHLFCRKDISTWILQNDSCPTCRRPFVEQLNPEQNDRRDPRYDTTNLGFSGMQITGEMVAFMRAFRDATEVDGEFEGEPEGELEDIDSRPRDHGEEAQERDEFIGLYS